MTKTKREQRFVVYLTRGNRGECRIITVDADTSDGAVGLAIEKWQGWRVYGVQLVLDNDHPEGG